MLEFITQLQPRFTSEDRERCLPIISHILELNRYARSKGFAELETEIEKEESGFFRLGLTLVVDGSDQDLLKYILQHLILSEDHTGYELLSRLIMAEGCLLLQDGESSRLAALRLMAMLGEEYCYQADADWRMHGMAEDIQALERFMESAKNRKTARECLKLELLMHGMSDQGIQRMLREIEDRDLFIVLSGGGYGMIEKIFRNIPAQLQMMLAERIERKNSVRVEQREETAKKIVKTIMRLSDAGELAL